MAAEYIEYYRVRAFGRDFDDDVLKVTERATRSVKTVHTMNPARTGRGYKRSNVAYDLELQLAARIDESDIDWHALHEGGGEFELVVKPNNKKPIRYLRCTVKDIGEGASEGDADRNVSIVSLKREKG